MAEPAFESRFADPITMIMAFYVQGRETTQSIPAQNLQHVPTVGILSSYKERIMIKKKGRRHIKVSLKY